MANKPVVIPGEASETDSDDDTDSKNKGAQAVQGAAIVGEDSESENESISVASARSALENTTIQDSTPEEPKYDTLFHQKLKECNIQLHNDIQGFCQNTITDANRQLNSIDQHLLKSQLTLQNAVVSLKSININLLKNRLHTLLSTKFLSNVNVDKCDNNK